MSSVLEQKMSPQGSTTSITLSATPTSTQGVIVVVARRDKGNIYDAVVSGGGATWTRIYKHQVGPSTYDQTVEVWKGKGFTSAGPIQQVSPQWAIQYAYHVDGDVDLASVSRDPAWSEGSKIGSTVAVAAGSAVIGQLGFRWGYPAVVPKTKAPATGWSTPLASGEINGWQQFWGMYRNAAIAENHHLENDDANLPASVLLITVPPAATVPKLYLGSTKIDKLALGSSEISAAFLGSSPVS